MNVNVNESRDFEGSVDSLAYFVRSRGFEPPRVAPLEPESSASAISPRARVGKHMTEGQGFQALVRTPPRGVLGRLGAAVRTVIWIFELRSFSLRTDLRESLDD